MTRRDTELAAAVSSAVVGLGVAIAPPDSAAYPRPVQMLELAIDALDIPAVRPFWRAVLGYGDEPGHDAGRTPRWSTRPARARRSGSSRWTRRARSATGSTSTSRWPVTRRRPRVRAALAAGGTLVSDEAAPSFWVLADAEGNEACVCTWLQRDERGW